MSQRNSQRLYSPVLAALITLTVIAQAAPADSNGPSPSDPLAIAAIERVFDIRHYAVEGSEAIDPEAVDQLMRGAVGTNVSLPQIRRALARLRDAYKERGFERASVTLPGQALESGTVRVRVNEGRAAVPEAVSGSGELPALAPPQYDIEHFAVRGNRSLSAEEIDEIIGPAAGPSAGLEGIEAALSKLRDAYRARGLRRASVSIPPQLLTDATIIIDVDEGRTDEAEAAAFAAPFTAPTNLAAAAPPAPRRFSVERYDIYGNTLLPEAAVKGCFTNAIGTNIALEDVQKALGRLQLAYRERGFASVSVALPQQRLTNAVVKVQVTEGKLVEARVSGNNHFSSNNVLRALPSLHTNQILNARVLQRELDIANQNKDRQIFPSLSPGPDPGTTAINLRVEDRLPLHARADLNNYSTPGTTDWRVNASMNYNNLWEREHQFGLSYSFTPEVCKTEGVVSDYFVNRPLVANYGLYYRIPFGAESVAQSIASSGRFGYDEEARQFRLPPAGPRPDISVYASQASTDSGVRYGSDQVVYQSTNFSMTSQDSGQDVTLNDTVGVRWNAPWNLSDTRRFSFSAGLDFRHFQLRSFNTNNYYETDVQDTGETNYYYVPYPQPAAVYGIQYLPLSAGVNFNQADRAGNLALGVGLTWNAMGKDKDFQALSYSTNARAGFYKATFSISREQQLRNGSLVLRANAQAASGPLINVEQFSLGGVNSVRGYYEGDEFGDSGWTGSIELRTPYYTTDVALLTRNAPVWLRGLLFVDGGQRYQMENDGHDSYRSLLGTGFGLSANLNNLIDARLSVGWPLANSANTQTREPRTYFSIGGQF